MTHEVELNAVARDVFTVTSGGALVTGVTGFTFLLFNPSGTEVSGTIVPVVSELSNGHYAVTFTPNAEGLWSLTILHAMYYPAGIQNTYMCTQRNAYLLRLLGLAHENAYLDNQVYTNHNMTSARLRIYSAAGSVGTSSDVLATYTITATYLNDDLTSYSMVKQ